MTMLTLMKMATVNNDNDTPPVQAIQGRNNDTVLVQLAMYSNQQNRMTMFPLMKMATVNNDNDTPPVQAIQGRECEN